MVIECMARKSAARSKVSRMKKERTSAIRWDSKTIATWCFWARKGWCKVFHNTTNRSLLYLDERIQSQVRARMARKEAQKRVERKQAAGNIQRLARGRAARLEGTTRRRRRDAAVSWLVPIARIPCCRCSARDITKHYSRVCAEPSRAGSTLVMSRVCLYRISEDILSLTRVSSRVLSSYFKQRHIQMAVRQRVARKIVGKKRKERGIAATRIQAGVRGSREKVS